ncbi:MAG: hypothetical protein GY928_01520 [Colwellia sp.]|nr:hypothetical protein [Colwellia sp.]
MNALFTSVSSCVINEWSPRLWWYINSSCSSQLGANVGNGVICGGEELTN